MIYCSWRLELAPRPIFTSLSPGAIFVDHDQADADGAGRCLVNMFLGKYLRWMLPRPLISTFITPINLVLDNKHFKVSSVATKSKYFFAVIQFSGKSQNETDYFCCSQSQLTLNFLCDFFHFPTFLPHGLWVSTFWSLTFLDQRGVTKNVSCVRLSTR